MVAEEAAARERGVAAPNRGETTGGQGVAAWNGDVSAAPGSTGASDASDLNLSLVLISLFKGVVDRDEQPRVWVSLLRLEPRVRDQVALFGLELVLEEAEGYAYLRQREPEEGEEALPRLVPRRPLSYMVSLLLALLRKKLAEHDAAGGETRLILTGEQLVDMVRLFLPPTGDEVRLQRRVERAVNQAVDLGFLRRLRGQDDRYEVRRILASFVDAQWLAEFEQRLAEYREHVQGEDE